MCLNILINVIVPAKPNIKYIWLTIFSKPINDNSSDIKVTIIVDKPVLTVAEKQLEAAVVNMAHISIKIYKYVINVFSGKRAIKGKDSFERLL